MGRQSFKGWVGRRPRASRSRSSTPTTASSGLHRPDLHRRAAAASRAWAKDGPRAAPAPGRRRPARARQPRRARSRSTWASARPTPASPCSRAPVRTAGASGPSCSCPTPSSGSGTPTSGACCPTTGSPSSARRRRSSPAASGRASRTSDTDTPAGARREVDAVPGRRVRRRAADLHGARPHADERGGRPRLRREDRGDPARGARCAVATPPKRKKLSERDEAILREGVAAWVAAADGAAPRAGSTTPASRGTTSASTC